MTKEKRNNLKCAPCCLTYTQIKHKNLLIKLSVNLDVKLRINLCDVGGYQGCETSVALPRILISCLTFLRLQPKMQSEASLRWKTPDWKNNNNQRTSNASHRIASRRPKAEAVSFVRQQVALWSQQEKKKNRKREEELGDWLTFPVRAAAVCPVAVAPMASGACDEHGEPPGGRPHSHPMGTGHRAERRCPVGSPESLTKIVQTFRVTQKQK